MTTNNITVHPVADLFPMLPTDELNTLAADIKARGQLQPIVLDKQSRIIDGRNRFAACQIADLDPQFITYEGDDAEGYALAVNIRRRNISKGQQAMIVAKAMRLNGARKSSTRKAAEKYGISDWNFSAANVVLDYAPDEADRVMVGIQPLNDAYETAKANKKAKDEEADELAELRAEAPDLADAVTEERLTFSAALEQLGERRQDFARAERVAKIDKLLAEDGPNITTFTDRVQAGELTWTEAETLAAQWKQQYDADITRHVNAIMRLNESWAYVASILRTPERTHSKTTIQQLSEPDRERLTEITKRNAELVDELREKGII